MSTSTTQRIVGWGAHATLYMLFLGLFASEMLPIPSQLGTVLSLVWLVPLALHVMFAFGAFGAAEPRKRQLEEKPKRRLELSDDGELVEIDEDNLDDTRSRLARSSNG